MVSINTYDSISTSKTRFEFDGLAGDTKPTSTYEGNTIANGSVFLEMDTGAVFMYDEENVTWIEL